MMKATIQFFAAILMLGNLSGGAARADDPKPTGVKPVGEVKAIDDKPKEKESATAVKATDVKVTDPKSTDPKATDAKAPDAKTTDVKPTAVEPTAKPDPKPARVSEPQTKKAEELFEAGRSAFFQSDYPTAIEKLVSAVHINPEKIGYKLLLAKAYRFAKENDKAVALLEEILKASPEHVEAGVELSDLLSPQKQPDRVIAVLTPLLKFKHDYSLFHLLAEAHYEKEHFDDARKYYEEAVKLNARSADDYYQLGNIYLNQQRFAKAAQSYETAGGLGYDTGAYHFKLASVYFNLHNYLGSVATGEVRGGKVGEIKNNLFLIDALPGAKDLFYAAGPRSAIYQVVKAQQQGIDLFEIHFLEANIWLSARRYAKADPIYKTLQEKVKKADAGLFWFYWATAALGLDQYDQYISRLERAIEAEPETYKSTLADAYVTVADRYHQQGDSAKYIEFLHKAVATNPLSARLHLMLGDAYWLENTRPKALEQYKLVLELEPDHSQRVHLLNRIRGQEETSGATPAGE